MMRRRNDGLSEDFHAAIRRAKRELIEADIPRPNALLVKSCFAIALISAVANLFAIWRGAASATAICFTISYVAAMTAMIAQMWQVIVAWIRKRGNNKKL